jgi:hypothetical protein
VQAAESVEQSQFVWQRMVVILWDSPAMSNNLKNFELKSPQQAELAK